MAQCHHKGSYKREAGVSVKEGGVVGDGSRDQREAVVSVREGDVVGDGSRDEREAAASQGMQAASRSREREGTDSPLEPLEGIQPPSDTKNLAP